MVTMTQDRFLTGRRVLLGIETKPIRDIVVAMVRDKGAEAVLFGNGADMIMEAEKFKPDLAYSEFFMHPMSGVEFVRALRDKIKVPFPMIMLVSDHDEDGHQKARQAGAVQSVRMPFSLNDIIAVTKKALEHGASPVATGLRFGPKPTAPPKLS